MSIIMTLTLFPGLKKPRSRAILASASPPMIPVSVVGKPKCGMGLPAESSMVSSIVTRGMSTSRVLSTTAGPRD